MIAELENDEALAERLRLLMELRGAGVRDTAVLSAFEQIAPEAFSTAPDALPPAAVAQLIAALETESRQTVLHAPAATGYAPAVLSRLARRVYTIEPQREALRAAEASFAQLGLPNLITRHGEWKSGWKEAAPFDRVLLTAPLREAPKALMEQLRPGGVLVLPVGKRHEACTLTRLRKGETGEISTEALATLPAALEVC